MTSEKCFVFCFALDWLSSFDSSEIMFVMPLGDKFFAPQSFN